MKNTGMAKYISLIPGLLLFFCLTGCKKTQYDLLDPSTAGKWTLINSQNSLLPGNSIYGLTRDKNNNMWAACYGNGVAKYQNGVWTAYSTSNSYILSNYTTSVATTSSGDIFIGTEVGLSELSAAGTWYYYKDATVPYMCINTIKVASDGALWIGTLNQGYYYYGGSGFQHYLSGYTVNAVAQDGSGNVWLGTNSGLYKYTGTHFTSASIPYLTASGGLPKNKITALFVDSKGRIWIGYYYGKTVSYLSGSTINQVSLMDGSDSTIVWAISEDKKGDIWFATDSYGLIRYDGVVPHSYKTYNYPNDIKENYFASICNDKDGNIWFGMYTKGILKYTLPLE
ncbi:MAG: two-component regulator propeller domain-containing protein [Bacteroidales bacterium]